MDSVLERLPCAQRVLNSHQPIFIRTKGIKANMFLQTNGIENYYFFANSVDMGMSFDRLNCVHCLFSTRSRCNWLLHNGALGSADCKSRGYYWLLWRLRDVTYWILFANWKQTWMKSSTWSRLNYFSYDKLHVSNRHHKIHLTLRCRSCIAIEGNQTWLKPTKADRQGLHATEI